MSNTLSTPNFTDLCRLAETIVLAEPEPNQKLLDEIDYIYQHVDEDIDINLAQLEMLVFYQIQMGGGLNKEIEINDKSYKIIDLYKYLDLVNKKLVRIVVALSKKYNVDIPLGFQQTTKLQY